MPPRKEAPRKRVPDKRPWVWVCRPGAENDLLEELEFHGIKAERLGVGLVKSVRRPKTGGGPIELTFARQGLPVDAMVDGDDVVEIASGIAKALRPKLTGARPFILQTFVPDSDETNPLSEMATRVDEAVRGELLIDDQWRARCVDARDSQMGTDLFAQACMLDRRRAVVGVLPAGQAVTLVPGGRRRIGAPKDAPSRASAKLLEAMDWIGQGPDPGDVCVDLGAAPGGWSWVLLERKARVVAVDPARLSPDVARRKGLVHVQSSAFDFLPTDPVDWLFCDMAWRPLEVAAMLTKWARHGLARFLLANIKLPMRKKVEYVRRVREILEDGGWRNLRFRQLYHDREEVTVVGYCVA